MSDQINDCRYIDDLEVQTVKTKQRTDHSRLWFAFGDLENMSRTCSYNIYYGYNIETFIKAIKYTANVENKMNEFNNTWEIWPPLLT